MREWSERVRAVELQVAAAREMWGADEGELARLEKILDDVLEQKSTAEWDLRQKYVTVWHEPPERTKRLGSRVSCGSPLRNELTSGDLDVEMTEELPSIDQNGLPFTTFWDFFLDRYMWMGPNIDWSQEIESVDRPECSSNAVAGEYSTPSERDTLEVVSQGDEGEDLVRRRCRRAETTDKSWHRLDMQQLDLSLLTID